MFIKIKGYEGEHNCDVTSFCKFNFHKLYNKIKYIYEKEFMTTVPDYYNEITTIKGLKEFVKENMVGIINNYPFGFKHIDGVYCLYEAYG